MSDIQFEESNEQFEILEPETDSTSDNLSDGHYIPDDLPESHTSLAADVDIDALEYESSVFESTATDLPGLGVAMYMGCGAGVGLIAEILSSSNNPELILGGAGAGLAVWAGVTARTAYKNLRKTSSETDINDIYLVADQDVEGFLEGQENVIIDIDGTNELWDGRDAAELYSAMEDLSIVTFEDYDTEDIDYQIDIFPSNTTFYGRYDEGSESFEDDEPLIENIAGVKQKLDRL